MTAPLQTDFQAADPAAIADIEGRVALFLAEDGSMDPLARRVDRLTRGAVRRLAAGGDFAKAKTGAGQTLAWPAGMRAEAVLVVKLPRRPTAEQARQAGAAIGGFNGTVPLTVLAGSLARVEDVALGLSLKAYSFDTYRTPAEDAVPPNDRATFMVKNPEAAAKAFAPRSAQAAGVFLTRDLVSEPANVLTTVEFAERLTALRDLGVDVEVLGPVELEKLGMRTLLAVGMASSSPSQVVVMRWMGCGDAAPLALLGKGVVFDTGGVSIKPAAGMEEMTMDMGGAGVVAGVMHTLAAREAKANVIGIVGLVENMLAGNAQRPGDVVKSMKGDTVEVINTDAEGRLVLADVLWYAQERFKPAAMIDLATLTGAIIVALGHEKAGVFSNKDEFAGDFLKAAEAEGEGAWRMPLDPAYDELLKSRIADVANVGGRTAGSVTAAQFLQRFVKDGMPWIHLDIAGAAYSTKPSTLAPKGATGWGVRAIDRLVRDRFEG